MPHQIRIQFSLRTLLVAVTIGGLGFGAFAVLLQRVRSQQRVVRELSEMKAHVYYDYQEASLGRYQPWPVPDGWMVPLLGIDWFHSVVAVEFFGPEFTDESLDSLWKLPHLRSVSIVDSGISVKGLASLHECDSLRSLCVMSSCQPGENGCIPDMNGGDVAREVARFKRLEILAIMDTAISDNGLRHLEQLSHLQQLTLSGPALQRPRFTKRGMKRLQEALPDCSIDIEVAWWLRPLELDE